MAQSVLSVANIVKHFPVRKGLFRRTDEYVRAVNGVSLELAQGETLGLVGESGCGKSTLLRIIIRLLSPNSGSIQLGGVDFLAVRGEQLRRRRHDIQIIFQDPYSSLDPRQRIGQALSEGLRIHHVVPEAEIAGEVDRLLALVGLEPDDAFRYPHAFSGGQRQRVCIARALAVRPQVILADEPVASLDVSIQAQILNLLMDLQQRFGLSYLFVSHDLRVVRQISHRIAVMYLGRIVESGSAAAVCERPRHPYTAALMSAVPHWRADQTSPRILLEGDPPDPAAIPDGCPFHPRCPHVLPDCRVTTPAWWVGDDGHGVACHLNAGRGLE